LDSTVTPGGGRHGEGVVEDQEKMDKKKHWFRRRERGGSIAMEGLEVPEGGRTFIIFS